MWGCSLFSRRCAVMNVTPQGDIVPIPLFTLHVRSVFSPTFGHCAFGVLDMGLISRRVVMSITEMYVSRD